MNLDEWIRDRTLANQRKEVPEGRIAQADLVFHMLLPLIDVACSTELARRFQS